MAEATPVAPVTAAGQYERFSVTRNPFLQRARDGALVTIPGLMPPEGASGSTTLYQPFQSVGARGVNNLASKMLLVLFPPGASFFRMKIAVKILKEIVKRLGAEAQQDFEKALSEIEQAVVSKLETVGARTQLFEFLKHLVVAGNGLLHILNDGRLKFYPLDRYVVKRDLDGDVLEIIVKETLSRAALSPRLKAMVPQDGEKGGDEETVPLYTWVRREHDGGSWTIHQEFFDVIVPDSEGTFAKDECAFIAGRWSAVPGEDYGRGFVEEQYGDLRSLESLSQSIVEFSHIASMIKLFYRDAGGATRQEIQDSPNGAILEGDAKDLTAWMLEKTHDFSVAKATHDEIKSRLEGSFLSASSIQRNAERVTAEEIRFMAGELEQALGGTYSIQAQELQAPLVRRYLRIMENGKEIPTLPDDTVTPQIVTGLDGLGRSSDLMKLDILLSGLSQMFGPEALAMEVKVGSYATRRATALGISVDNLFYTEEEKQQRMQQQTMQSVAPQLVDLMGQAATKPTEEPVG